MTKYFRGYGGDVSDANNALVASYNSWYPPIESSPIVYVQEKKPDPAYQAYINRLEADRQAEIEAEMLYQRQYKAEAEAIAEKATIKPTTTPIFEPSTQPRKPSTIQPSTSNTISKKSNNILIIGGGILLAVVVLYGIIKDKN